MNCVGLPESIWHIWELFKSSQNYLRYPRTLHENTGRKENDENNSGPLGPLYKHTKKSMKHKRSSVLSEFYIIPWESLFRVTLLVLGD